MKSSGPVASASALVVQGVGNSFGPTRALVDAEFSLESGLVLALIGENGSGKSTMVKILTGVHRPDEDIILLQGEPYAPRSPIEAIMRGVVAVYQEILAVPGRTVLDNIWLGSGGFFSHPLPKEEQARIASYWIERLIGKPLDLDLQAAQLTVSAQQAVCVARALVREPKLLILDEATSALDVETRDNLFAIVRERSEGADDGWLIHDQENSALSAEFLVDRVELGFVVG